MIGRWHGYIVIECDTCGETYEGEPDEQFERVWSDAKGWGWTARKIGTDWVHGCPDCGAPE